MLSLRSRRAWSNYLPPWLIAFLVIVMPVSSVIAAQVNLTIDDTSVEPVNGASVKYGNIANWRYGPDCVSCSLRVIPMKETFNHSWTDGLVNPNDKVALQTTNLTLSFTGTAIYVFGITPNVKSQSPDKPSLTNLTFTLDGSPSDTPFFSDNTGGFQEDPSLPKDANSANFLFNTLVYHTIGLENKNHELVISFGSLVNNTNNNSFLFDYATYTFEGTLPSGPSPNSNSPTCPAAVSDYRRPLTAAIASGVVGWVMFVASAVIIVFHWLRNTRPVRVSSTSNNKVTSYVNGADLDHELATSPELLRDAGGRSRHSTRFRPEKSSSGPGAIETAHERSIQARMDTLQAEMDSLRAQNAEVIAEVTRGPPAY